MTIKALILEAQAIVEALGVRAVISPNDLAPPCVLIGSPRFTMQNAIGAGGFVATARAGDGMSQALDHYFF